MKLAKYIITLFAIQSSMSMQITDEQSHEFHVLAQQTARTYLTIATKSTSRKELTQDLEKFITQYPPLLRPYINLSAFIQFVHPETKGCLCQELKKLLNHTPSSTLMQLIEQLPANVTATFHQALRERQEDLALFTLALGADYTIPVPIALTCRCCSQSVLIPPTQEIPVAKLCSHMPRLKQRVDKRP